VTALPVSPSSSRRRERWPTHAGRHDHRDVRGFVSSTAKGALGEGEGTRVGRPPALAGPGGLRADRATRSRARRNIKRRYEFSPSRLGPAHPTPRNSNIDEPRTRPIGQQRHQRGHRRVVRLRFVRDGEWCHYLDHSALDLGRPDIKCETRNFGVGRPDPVIRSCGADATTSREANGSADPSSRGRRHLAVYA